MTENSDAFKYDPAANYDDDTMAQQRNIEKEIAASQPLISPFLKFDDISEEYAKEDNIYLKKIEELKTRYKVIRRTRGDGNCFFRAFGFAYLEKLLTSTEEYKRFTTIAKKSKDDLVALGFPEFTLEDFHDTFMDIVSQVEDPGTIDKLTETFNDQGLSDYFVVYLRLLVSGHLQGNEDSYMPFIDEMRTVKEFCNQEVEPMGKESDHIHIVALAKALGVGVSVEYMDRGVHSKCTVHHFPASDDQQEPQAQKDVTLLYRPGHYDIIYPL